MDRSYSGKVLYKNGNSTLNSFLVIVHTFCQEPNLKCLWAINFIKVETSKLDRSYPWEVLCTRMITPPWIFFELLPFVIFNIFLSETWNIIYSIFILCSSRNLKSIWDFFFWVTAFCYFSHFFCPKLKKYLR